MKKVWFVVALVIYALLAILGLFRNSYTEVYSLSRAANKYLLFLVIAAIVIGFLFFYWFKKTFPNGYSIQNQLAKILIPVVCIILSFAFNRAILQVINVFGHQQELIVSGYIYAKKIEKSRKTNFYHLILRDTVNGEQYEFNVKKKVFYGNGKEGDQITKQFLVGSLGIIYRRRF